MANEKDPKIEDKEWSKSSEKTIKETTENDLTENLNMDKEKIKKQLEAAKNVENRVKLFSKRTDSYWLEAIVWIIPAIWDLTPAIISSCYLIAEWIHIWLPWQDCLKILWYQGLDVLVWAIPIIWDIADFFFKWNRYSAQIFSEHLEKLKKAAIEKGISPEEINNMWKKEAIFIKTMDKYIDHKSKKKAKKKEHEVHNS